MLAGSSFSDLGRRGFGFAARCKALSQHSKAAAFFRTGVFPSGIVSSDTQLMSRFHCKASHEVNADLGDMSLDVQKNSSTRGPIEDSLNCRRLQMQLFWWNCWVSMQQH